MKSNKYKEKLKEALRSFGLSESSIVVYLAGSQDKKPNGEIRYALSQMKGIKHPFNAWGLNMKEYLDAQEQKANKGKK
ncbi:Uncharacterised protein [Campylobacter hyointestinalis subsp. hyointestinalis]|uniref:Uncharacterized protein n=1 Tax=Campylobacter hyointestinalis subsp. hyointestinalis TaxID=91352 RepID=A0A9W5ARN5_CAMHY|nr:hypothetical protein [Campylobacter hyointestinalis]CUU81668.1 Uncharacterised protein [Campylobacter hyointestinalis subsp. hyointestinalis]CUU89337.1 Uncharacterised protein [Campylobacter hyointestinalis]